MTYVIEHRKYDHQVRDAFKHPNTAPFWVWNDRDHVAVIREVAGMPEEHGFDLRLDCETADEMLRASIDRYFAPRKVVYLEHPGWKWNDRGESEPGQRWPLT
jgi:hypothetical protein